jgi:ABC-type transport system involved in cytochrome c biogenesis permease subunit
MSANLNFLFLVTVLVYLATSIFHTLSLVIGNRTEVSVIRPTIERIAFWGTTLGFGMLTLFIVLWWVQQGHFPMTHWMDSAAFFAWAITLIYLIIFRLTHLRALGSFVMPVAFIAILISYSFPRNVSAPSELLKNYWVIPHVTLIILSFAAFIAAFGFALMYLMAEKKIRDKTHPLLHNLLPSLGISDELGYLCIIFGVILLTIGVVVGSLLTQYIGELPWKWLDPKFISTLVTWLIYVTQIGIRQFWGWRGKKAAYASIIGFIAVLCTYVGVDIFLESIHEFR